MSKPINILLIHADQHRYDCLGVSGNPEIKTPHIDALAKDSIYFENSFCPFPICTPSRYSMLTGLYPHQHLGWTNHSTIPTGLSTLPKTLKENGFTTSAVGKMHFTPTYLDVGFDTMCLAEQNGNGRYEDDYHQFLMKNNQMDKNDLIDQVEEYRRLASESYWDSFGAMPSNLDEDYHSTTWIGKKAIESIQKWKKSCNFLMVGFIKPHHPFDPPERYANMYNPGELTLLPGYTKECLSEDIQYDLGYFDHNQLDETKLKKIMALYYASITQIDDWVGKIIETLMKNNLYDNTLIIYTSDHGDYMGFHHMMLKCGRMYDPLMKVPLIIKQPFAKDSIRSSSLVSGVDLAGFILKEANILGPKEMKTPLLSNGTTTRDYIFAEDLKNGKPCYMIRSKNRKLLLYFDEELCQFFDLEKDAYELTNLYHDSNYKQEISEMKETLHEWLMYETPTPFYLNEKESTCSCENSQKGTSDYIKESYNYFNNKMVKTYE